MEFDNEIKPLIDKKAFLGLEDCTWLFNGAETPPHTGVMTALNEYIIARSQGPRGREQNTYVETNCRNNVARLLHGQPENIAFMSNSSEAISSIAHSLDLQPGDNVVINTLEFPSGVYPWLLYKDKGVEVRVIEHRNWQVSSEDILEAVDERTKLVMTSHVSFLSGYRLDNRKLYSELKKTNALLLLDVTQSLGAVPVYMDEADFVVCSSYKWLFSVHGLGILGVNPARVQGLQPKSAGWRGVKDLFHPDRFTTFEFTDDARKFELGYPSYPTIYTLNFTSGLLLDIGEDRIEKHILDLGQYLIDGLQRRKYHVITPVDRENRAGNISFLCEDAVETAAELLKRNIYVWGGDGRIRASIHLFNETSDIDCLLSALSRN